MNDKTTMKNSDRYNAGWEKLTTGDAEQQPLTKSIAASGTQRYDFLFKRYALTLCCY